MLLRYFTYVTVGFFYAYSFLLFAGLATAIGKLVLLGFLGALLLFAIASALVLFWPRVSRVFALAGAALLSPWCVGWAFEMASSDHPEERWLFLLPCLPVLLVSLLALRPVHTASLSPLRMRSRGIMARAFLAAFPISPVTVWQVWLRAAA